MDKDQFLELNEQFWIEYQNRVNKESLIEFKDYEYGKGIHIKYFQIREYSNSFYVKLIDEINNFYLGLVKISI